jgi:hypothetical protein
MIQKASSLIKEGAFLNEFNTSLPFIPGSRESVGRSEENKEVPLSLGRGIGVRANFD